MKYKPQIGQTLYNSYSGDRFTITDIKGIWVYVRKNNLQMWTAPFLSLDLTDGMMELTSEFSVEDEAGRSVNGIARYCNTQASNQPFKSDESNTFSEEFKFFKAVVAGNCACNIPRTRCHYHD